MLSFIILLPLIAALMVLVVPQGYCRRVSWVSAWMALALVVAGAPGLAEVLGLTWRAELAWMDALGVRIRLDNDGLSYLLVLLTALLYPLSLWAVPASSVRKPRLYDALLLFTQAPLFGVFLARDALIFYIFYELALIPIFFLVAFWGTDPSRRITMKFFIYTLAGSLFLFVAILYLYLQTPQPHSFAFDTLYALPLTAEQQALLFAALFFAFAVKIPIFPFHTWQPDTYTAAPLGGSILLAGIMLKMGIYGLMRLAVPVIPSALEHWGWLAMVLCIAGTLYGSLVALRQTDLKRLVAYSSLAHVGLIAAGVLTANSSGWQGAALQMFNHGIIVFALFFSVDLLERRYGTRQLNQLGGVAAHMRHFSWMFALVLLASVGLPLTNGFVGEVLLLNGLFQYHTTAAVFAGLAVVLSVAYMLRWYRLVFFGAAHQEPKTDVRPAEAVALSVCLVLILVIGIYPLPWLQMTEQVTSQLLSIMHHPTAVKP
ncbi:MAG: NADH-quinone oxidoreductase subunit M [Chitinophagales bacterium]|nr:NADH-quinone oxidoreductase subunit M [Chitinophagales bacterium]MDW8428407.1 NADH-quinone oxidoreductase subunit M [Chitinophagales bacterium]